MDEAASIAAMKPLVLSSGDATALAADQLCAAVQAAGAERGRARVAISGGSALGAWVYACTALKSHLPHVWLTWTDERRVPHADPQSNFGEAHRQTTARGQFELPLYVDGEPVEDALSRVRSRLSAQFDDALDVTLLGMGPDGHIASLFPGHDREGDRVAFEPESPKPPSERFTLTTKFLATASQHVLLAMGESKREAIERVLHGDPALPATQLSPLTICTNLTDLREP